jgi:hypothetical protein
MADTSLPSDIVEAIAISNAKSIGEQPAILANLALAQQIFNLNMQQQIALSQQQAVNQVTMAAAASCVAMITKGGGGGDSDKALAAMQEIGKLFGQISGGGGQRDDSDDGTPTS